MLQILAVTGPIYLLITIGYLAVRSGLFAPEGLRSLGQFAFHFGITALIFDTLASRPMLEVLDAHYLLAYAGASLILLLGGYGWARWRCGAEPALAALQGMGMACSNSGYIGYPIVFQALGPVAAVALALCLLVENLVVMLLALILVDLKPDQNKKAVLRQAARITLRNPLLWAMATGVAFSVFEWQLPHWMSQAVKLLAASTAPVGLFVVGGSLVGLKLAGLHGDLARVAIGKLVLHPLLVGALFWLWTPANATLAAAGVLFAAMPMLGIYTVLAQRHGHQGFAAAAALVTTLASFFTVSLLLWGLQQGLRL